MNIYIMYDNVSKEFTPTFEQNTDEAAVRALLRDDNIHLSMDDLSICNLGFTKDGHVYCKDDCDIEKDFIPLETFIVLHNPKKEDKSE